MLHMKEKKTKTKQNTTFYILIETMPHFYIAGVIANNFILFCDEF